MSDNVVEIIRKIGKHEVLVNINEGMELSFEDSLLKNFEYNKDDGTVSLSKKEILKILSTGNNYLPLSLHWELLDKCNYACPFCYIVGHSRCEMLEFEKIEKHLSALIDNGLLFCLLSGGEVTIHPDFYQIYHFLKSKGVIVEILTNGYHIDSNLLELYEKLKPSKIEISIYSLDNKKLQYITGINDYKCAEKVLGNISIIKELGINVVCKTFVNKITYRELSSIQSWCEQRGIEHYHFFDVMNAYDGKNLQKFKAPEIPSESTAKKYKRKICFPCPGKHYACSINPSFEISPCSLLKLPECNFSLFDLGVNQALNLIWEFVSKYNENVINGCENCQYSEHCNICIANAIPTRNGQGYITGFSTNPEICIKSCN